MTKKLLPIYIGAFVNRDLEIFEEIRKFCKLNYNISIVNLFDNKGKYSIKSLKKKIKKYPLSFIILKLFSEESNQVIYDTIRKTVPNIPLLNSLNAVSICESRRKTFRFMAQNCKKLMIPDTYYSLHEALNAIRKKKEVIVKFDEHNIPFFPKEERIIGIAKTSEELKKLVKSYKEETLFFQEYLGSFNIIYKVYVIDRWVVTITSKDKLDPKSKLTPLELVHIRVPIDKQFKRRILRLGRKLQMPIFGLDYVVKGNTPYIVDLNDFPSFRSIPEATSLISDYVYNHMINRRLAYKPPVKVKM